MCRPALTPMTILKRMRVETHIETGAQKTSQKKETTLIRKLRQATLATIVAATLLFLVPMPRLQADDRAKCQHAVERAEARLDKAIHDHGEHSRAADERRRDLNAERERCWNEHHQWWNGREHRWETEHNWEDHH